MTDSVAHSKNSPSVAIIGAGLSGLMAGRVLQEAGVTPVILDKGRGVGGRCATRRIDDRRFDHGAQFFTVRSALLAEYVQEWLKDGLIREWSQGFPGEALSIKNDSHPRYCSVTGMNAIPKHLATGLPVTTDTTVSSVFRFDSTWTIETTDKNTHHADWLLMTAPLPQTLNLLPTDLRTSLLERYPALNDVHYEPCFSVMLVLDGPSAIPEPGAVSLNGPEIAWIADNGMKLHAAQPGALTIHSTREFAENHMDTPKEDVAKRLIEAARDWIGSTILQQQVHRWRYSKPLGFAGVPCVTLGSPTNLLLCGDYMQTPSRMEGALLSGVAAAQSILSMR